MNRSDVREEIFMLLFRTDFHKPEELKEQFDLFAEDEKSECDILVEDLDEVEKYIRDFEQEEPYIKDKFFAIIDKLSDIDAAINEKAEGWKTTRMAKVDLTIIRLAVYEIKYDENVPNAVAINEAVELAKKFGGETSPAFVNGVLAKFA